ncbi:unnamed protein product [Rodentolepis nana]|uniref:Uncharacterized protein n=1 Tax=Rodentolepis nana TaxID=102285 RepID=A0A0R3T8S3_RODNA|nr:unnamed protein product [Rodentolepis nana]
MNRHFRVGESIPHLIKQSTGLARAKNKLQHSIHLVIPSTTRRGIPGTKLLCQLLCFRRIPIQGSKEFGENSFAQLLVLRLAIHNSDMTRCGWRNSFHTAAIQGKSDINPRGFALHRSVGARGTRTRTFICATSIKIHI